MIFRVAVIGKSDAFCNLPELLVARIPNRTSAVIQFCWDGKDCDSQQHFVSWIGGISDTEALELPSSQFDSCRGSDTLRIEAVLTDIAEAEEVHFVPNSSYDWDIISTQAEIVERKLLMQLSIAYGGQTIRIYISPSLTVVLKCTDVRTKPASFSALSIQNRLSDSASSSSTTTESRGDNSTNGAAVVPVKLCANTLAVVAPYTSPGKMSRLEKSGNVDKNNLQRNVPRKTVLTLVEEGSMKHHLRALPQMFRVADTSHRSHRNIFGQLFEDRNNKRDSIKNGSSDRKIGLMRDMLLEYSCVEESLMDADQQDQYSNGDDYSCFIHPSFLDCAYRTAVNAMQDEPAFGENERARVINFNLNSNYIGIIRINRGPDDCKTAKPASNLPLMDSLIVGVKLSCSVRPLHISLSSSAQKALSAQDYSSVQLRLLGTTGDLGENSFRSPIMPSVISLQPIEWRTALEGDESASKSNIQRKIGKHTAAAAAVGGIPHSKIAENSSSLKNDDSSPARLDAVRESFVRFFEKHHTNALALGNSNSSNDRSRFNENCPLVIGHGSIVSLTHRCFDHTLRTDDLLSAKYDCDTSLDSTLSQRAGVREVVVDYLVGVHKSCDRDKGAPEFKKQSDATKKDGDVEDDKRILVLDFTDDYCVIDSEEMLLDCLDVLVLGDKKVAFAALESSVKEEKPTDALSLMNDKTSQFSAVTADFDQHRPAISLNDILSTNKTAATVAVDALSILLPTALEGGRGGRCPPLGSLLIGPRSSGKSTLCHSLAVFLRDSCRTVAHTEVLDCKELKGRPTKEILNRLSEAFQTAKTNSPSFLCLDNLDAICPAQPEGTTGISSTQQRLVSLKLECLLADLSSNAAQSYSYLAKFIAQLDGKSKTSRLSVWDRDSVSEMKNNSMADSACGLPSAETDMWELDLAVGRVLRNAVYVLATGMLFSVLVHAVPLHIRLYCESLLPLNLIHHHRG